jgi:hypothetical protein
MLIQFIIEHIEKLVLKFFAVTMSLFDITGKVVLNKNSLLNTEEGISTEKLATGFIISLFIVKIKLSQKRY